jgi:uncharacterized protein (DUF2141 family)
LIAFMVIAPAGADAQTAGVAPGDLTVRFEGLRSSKGLIRACMTRNPAFYPDCEKDPAAFKMSVAAQTGAMMEISNVPPGDYALVVLHDENSNAKVDTMLGIPREGVGFSRNAPIRFGPPKWDAVKMHVQSGPSDTRVKIKYFL